MLTLLYIVEFIISQTKNEPMKDADLLPALLITDAGNIVVGILFASLFIL